MYTFILILCSILTQAITAMNPAITTKMIEEHKATFLTWVDYPIAYTASKFGEKTITLHNILSLGPKPAIAVQEGIKDWMLQNAQRGGR